MAKKSALNQLMWGTRKADRGLDAIRIRWSSREGSSPMLTVSIAKCLRGPAIYERLTGASGSAKFGTIASVQ